MRRLLAALVAPLLLAGASIAPVGAATSQTQGRIVPLRVTVRGDDVTFRYLHQDIGKDPVGGAEAFYSGTETLGCDVDGDQHRDLTARGTQTRRGTYVVEVRTKASVLGSGWEQALTAYEDLKEPWQTTAVNTDPRLQFTCGVPNESSVDIVYREEPDLPTVVRRAASIAVTQTADTVLTTTVTPDCGQGLMPEYRDPVSGAWVRWGVSRYEDSAHDCRATPRRRQISIDPGPSSGMVPSDLGTEWRVRVEPNAFSTDATSDIVTLDPHGSPRDTVQVERWGVGTGATRVGSTLGVTPTQAEPGATVSQVWQVGDAVVGERARLRLLRSYEARVPSVTITVTKPGRRPRSRLVVFDRVTLPPVSVQRWSSRRGGTRIGSTTKVTATRAAGSVVRYAWIVGGRVVDRDRTLAIRRAWRGRTVVMRVTVSRADHVPATRTLKFARVHR